MNKYSVINLKTNPKLKAEATQVASKLGISISAVLNNELRRFATEQSVVFDIPEAPNKLTAKHLAKSKLEIESGNYHSFKDNKQAIEFLNNELK